ncbi:hypothetical protein ACLEPN_27675, partial [Myxococcus sp. 1LA]
PARRRLRRGRRPPGGRAHGGPAHGAAPSALPEDVRAVPTVREALAWARFPLVQLEPLEEGGRKVRIADLRYHLRGEPTLAFVIHLDAANAVTHARMERGGSARELLRRWRGTAAP